MDSGNSGSMQSSSGGDDQEFHSSTRGASDSISSFLNPQNNNTFTPQQHFNPFFNPQTLDFPLTTHHYTNPPSNDQLINWSLTTTSTNRSHSQLPQQQNYTNFTTPSSSNSQPLLPITTTTNTQTPFSNPRAEPEPLTYRAGPDQHLSNVIKNPKKRTRASRRAPTTVLTTDTTNFRQMVQEFTGIPAVPFSGSPYARRLDLFSSGLRPDAFGPIYPLRPAAQKYVNTAAAAFANNATSLLDSNTNDNNNNQNFTLASGDQLRNQQFHHQVQNQNITLQNLMSGYNNPSQETTNQAETGQVVRGNDGNNNNRWRNNNNNSNDGVQENNSMVVQQFDGNNRSTGNGDQNVQVQEEHVNVMSGSGYNLNLVSEKNVADHQGNVTASWICNSD